MFEYLKIIRRHFGDNFLWNMEDKRRAIKYKQERITCFTSCLVKHFGDVCVWDLIFFQISSNHLAFLEAYGSPQHLSGNVFTFSWLKTIISFIFCTECGIIIYSVRDDVFLSKLVCRTNLFHESDFIQFSVPC